jgi:Protein of unknown function (DUF1176)
MVRLVLALLLIGLTCVDLNSAPVLPRETIEAGLKEAKCAVSVEEASDNLSVQALSRGFSLVEVSCWTAVYNNGSLLFVVPARQKVRLLRFQAWNGKAFVAALSLSAPSYDGKSKRLTSFHKGSGPGDCGSMGEWQWTGSDFKMIGYWSKDKCDGKPFGFGNNVAAYRVFPKR